MKKRKRFIEGPEDIEERVRAEGFLPFFVNECEGFSLEEATPPEFWFPDEGEGVWEWKGPVIGAANCAYGKFFRKKAGFVSEAWFPDFANWRRTLFPVTPDEKMLLSILKSEESLLSKELRALAGYGGRKATRVRDGFGKLARLEAAADGRAAVGAVRRESFETAVTRLQMGCRVVTSDFEYSVDRRGHRYGWGIARYCRAESFFGSEALRVPRSPGESRARVLAQLAAINPRADARLLERMLDGK